MEPACTEGIPSAWGLGDVAPLDQRRQQVVAGGDVEAGAAGQFGERQTARGARKYFDQGERAIDRLDAAASGIPAPGRAAARGDPIRPRVAGWAWLYFSVHRASRYAAASGKTLRCPGAPSR